MAHTPEQRRAYRQAHLDAARARGRAEAKRRLAKETPETRAKRLAYGRMSALRDRTRRPEVIRERMRANQARYRKADPEHFRVMRRKYYLAHQAEILAKKRQESATLAASYVTNRLGGGLRHFTADLIAAKRAQLQLKRVIRDRARGG